MEAIDPSKLSKMALCVSKEQLVRKIYADYGSWEGLLEAAERGDDRARALTKLTNRMQLQRLQKIERATAQLVRTGEELLREFSLLADEAQDIWLQRLSDEELYAFDAAANKAALDEAEARLNDLQVNNAESEEILKQKSAALDDILKMASDDLQHVLKA